MAALSCDCIVSTEGQSFTCPYHRKRWDGDNKLLPWATISVIATSPSYKYMISTKGRHHTFETNFENSFNTLFKFIGISMSSSHKG
jgi:hypothetical protein